MKGFFLNAMSDLARMVPAAMCAALILCGCATRPEVTFDAQHPAVRVSRHGVLFGDEYVRPQEVAEILDGYDVPRSRTIHIRLDSDVRDLRPARDLMARLCRAGYKSPVLVTERHAESMNLGKQKRQVPPPRRETRRFK